MFFNSAVRLLFGFGAGTYCNQKYMKEEKSDQMMHSSLVRLSDCQTVRYHVWPWWRGCHKKNTWMITLQFILLTLTNINVDLETLSLVHFTLTPWQLNYWGQIKCIFKEQNLLLSFFFRFFQDTRVIITLYKHGNKQKQTQKKQKRPP